MKILRGLLILSTLIVFGSCGEVKEGDEALSVTMSESSFILPNSASSCVGLNPTDDTGIQLDVNPFRAAINKIKFSWTKTSEDLTIAFIRVEFKDANVGGEFKATISGPELDLLLGTLNGLAGHATVDTADDDEDGSTTDVKPLVFDNASSTFLPQTGITVSKRPCSLQIGGIQVVTEDVAFTATGRVTVVAIATGNGLSGNQLAEGEEAVEEGVERAIRLEQEVTFRYEF